MNDIVMTGSGAQPLSVRETLKDQKKYAGPAVIIGGGVAAYGFLEGKNWAKVAGLVGAAVAALAWWRAHKELGQLSTQETRAMAEQAVAEQIASGRSTQPGMINGERAGTGLPS